MTRDQTVGTLALTAAKAGTWCSRTPRTGCVKTTISSLRAASLTSARSYSWRRMNVLWVRILHFEAFAFTVNNVCFIFFFLWSVSDHPICGNQIVEKGEQCDVGHNDEDLCCYSAKQPAGVQCYLKPEKKCRCPTSPHIHQFNPSSSSIPGARLAYMILSISPSQGLCCQQDCGFKPAGWTCDEETDCQRASVCSGLSPYCPEPSAKENLTLCSLGTRVCLNGVSIHQPLCQILHYKSQLHRNKAWD